MDCCSFHVKNNSNRFPLISHCLQRNNNHVKLGCRIGLGNFGINSTAIRVSGYRSLLVQAIDKKGHDESSLHGSSGQSVPEGDGSQGSSCSPERHKSDDTTIHDLHHKTSDWRTARAIFVKQEPALLGETDVFVRDGACQGFFKPLGPKWAHPIAVPEPGCILLATEKLDGVPYFERSVILLLQSGNRSSFEGPVGVIINHPLHKGIKHVKPVKSVLPAIFTDCTLHFGGPLEASMFLLNRPEKSQLPGLEQVIPSLCFGDRDSLIEATRLVRKGELRPQDFRFFIGYAGWQWDQLREEIESGYWYVASCSEYFINGSFLDSSSDDMRGEILQLMGGQYSEISTKPKQDGIS